MLTVKARKIYGMIKFKERIKSDTSELVEYT